MRTLVGLVLSLLGSPLTAQFALGHTTVAWSDPDQGGQVVTAELWYPAQVAGEDVAVAPPPPGGFPILSFGHGYQIPADRYSYVWEALVPEGYVLALATTQGGLFPSHASFAADLAYLVRRLRQETQTPGSLWEGALSERAAVLGHSMGGGASFLSAALDPTIDAVANLAAADTNPSAIAAAASVAQPTLLIAGSSDCVTPPAQHQIPMHAASIAQCKLLVTLEGGSHCGFADDGSLCELGELFCSSPLSDAVQQQWTTELLGAWLDAQLRDSGSAWADFQALLSGQASLSAAGACALEPQIESVLGVDHASSGSVALSGTNLQFVEAVQVDGVGVAIELQSASALEFAVSASDPGFQDLQLQTAFSNQLEPQLVPRYPALAAGAAALGSTLELALSLGGPAQSFLALSPDFGPGLALGGIDHVLELATPLVVGSQVLASAPWVHALSLPIPSTPSLLGITLHLQGLSLGGANPSFSNRVERTLGS